MNRFRLAVGVCAAVLALGCSKRPGPASPEFQKARQQYLDLLAKDGPNDVYLDPGITAVRMSLDRVPPDSVDADAAKSLAGTIDKGIAEAKANQAAREAAKAETAKAADAPVPSLGGGAQAPAVAAAQPAQPAQPAPTDGPHEGMSAAEFQTKFGGCFDKDSVFKDTQGHTGDAYVLSAACATRYPSFKDQLVLVSNAKVLNVVPRSAEQGRQEFQVQSSKPLPQAPQPPPPQQPPPVYGEVQPPPPPNPNTVDQRVGGADSRVNAPSNLNSDLDARTKLPGQP